MIMEESASILHRIVGKSVWISGATQGLGLKICERLIDSGCSGLAMTDIVSEATGIKTVQELTTRAKENGYENTRVIFSRVDVREPDVVERSMRAANDELNGLDIVINCAGVSDESNLTHTLEVNTIATIRAIEKAIRIFSEEKEKHKHQKPSLKTILNISSAAGLIPLENGEYYTASKHAVVGYSKSIAMTVVKDGIRVLCLCPGWIDVGMGQRAIEMDHDTFRNSHVSVLKADEVTYVVLLLVCSQRLAGEVIYMSGDREPCLSRVSIRKPLIPQAKL